MAVTKISTQQLSDELYKIVGKNYLFVNKENVTLDLKEVTLGIEQVLNTDLEQPTWKEVNKSAIAFIRDPGTEAIITVARITFKDETANQIKLIADRAASDILAKLEEHIADKNNPHEVTVEQLGLENVDNTSDVDKPISKAVQEALDEITSDASDLESRVATNETNIANNRTDIDTNNERVHENAEAIDLLSQKEAQDVAVLNAKIATNKDNIQANADDIAELQTKTTDDKAELEEKIEANKTAIEDLTTQEAQDVADLDARITTNANNIAQNTTDIATNKDNIETNRTEIAKNTLDIDQNKDSIIKNKEAIEALKQQTSDDKSELEGKIQQNADDIDALEAADITLQSNIDTNATNIATNATEIANIKQKDTDQDTEIANIKQKNTDQDTEIANIKQKDTDQDTAIDERVTKTEAATFVKDIAYDGDTCTFTFTMYDDSTESFDLPLESAVKSGYYVADTKELVLVLIDNTEIKIPVVDLFDVYTGKKNDQIEVAVSKENVIEAVLQADSVAESFLTPEIRQKLADYKSTLDTHTSQISAIETKNTEQDTEIQNLHDKDDEIDQTITDFRTDMDTEIARIDEDIANLDTELSDRITDEVNTLNETITDLDNTLNEKIDTEVETLNETITDLDTTVNERIDTEVETLNDRIDTEVETLNTTIDDKEQALQEQIDQNASDISTNAADIATNKTNIQTNADNIAQNATDITTNKGLIDGLDTRVTTNESAISTNATNIATNTADIATNKTNIQTNATNIATNTADIATNKTNIQTNADDIAALETKEQEDIDALEERVTTNETDIATNKANISTNATNIAQNTADIATNKNDILTHSTQIASNSAHIATNTTDINELRNRLDEVDVDVGEVIDRVSANETNIATNTSNIASNATAIAKNATDIATNAANIATNTTDIKNNKDSIITNSANIAENALSIASNTKDIATNKTEIANLKKERDELEHFRGYYATDTEVENLVGHRGDYAYSAESGVKWVYDATSETWAKTSSVVPDQMVPKTTTVPKMDGDEAQVGTETSYAAGDHIHPHDTTKADQDDLDAHTLDYTNPHQVTKTQVGLGNVDNTSDADKPVSSAQKTFNDDFEARISDMEAEIPDINTALDGKAPTNHASTLTTYGLGDTTNYGHVKTINNLTTNSYTAGYALNAYQGYLLQTNKAPNDHASTGTTYGLGTESNYGHVRIINNLTTSSNTSGYALSAYQGKVLSDKFANYLPLAGGEITGNLTVDGTTTLKGAVTANSTMSVNGNLQIGDPTDSSILRRIIIGDINSSNNKPYVYIGEDADDVLTLYSDLGINLNVGSGSIAAGSDLYVEGQIDATGNLIIDSDNTNNATIQFGTRTDTNGNPWNYITDDNGTSLRIHGEDGVTLESYGVGSAYVNFASQDGAEVLLQMNGENLIIDNLTSSYTTRPLSAYQGKVLNDAISGKAPTNHATSATTYGLGTTGNYGHVKLANNLTTNAYADGVALSAYQGYLLQTNKAPNSHASTATTYGVATTSAYGHVKVTTGNGLALSSGTLSMAAASTSAVGGVQLNNTLTSDSTTQALTAAQGKALNTKFSSYLPLTGGTLTGALTISTNNSSTMPLTINSGSATNQALKVTGTTTFEGDVRIGTDTSNFRTLRFGDSDYCMLYEQSDDTLVIKSAEDLVLKINSKNSSDVSGTGTLRIENENNTSTDLNILMNGTSYVINNLISTSTTRPLSAYQGKLLSDKIATLGDFALGNDVSIKGNLTIDSDNTHSAIIKFGTESDASGNEALNYITTDVNGYSLRIHGMDGITLESYGSGSAYVNFASQDGNEVNLQMNGEDLIIDNLTSTSTTRPLSANQGRVLNANKAPNSHASTNTTYGVGTTSSYGHCKTINDLTQSSYTNGYALSAYQGKVLNDRLKTVEELGGITSDYDLEAMQYGAEYGQQWYDMMGYNCSWCFKPFIWVGTGSGSQDVYFADLDCYTSTAKINEGTTTLTDNSYTLGEVPMYWAEDVTALVYRGTSIVSPNSYNLIQRTKSGKNGNLSYNRVLIGVRFSSTVSTSTSVSICLFNSLGW